MNFAIYNDNKKKWHLSEIFFLAMLFGGYLTGATLALFVIARDTTFFQDKFNLHTLTDPELRGLLYLFVCSTYSKMLLGSPQYRSPLADKPLSS
jgi:hypothetical protein